MSTVYGMFDMFMSAGRDWGFIVDGRPGDSLIAPRVVAATREPFAAGNGVTIHPDATFEEAGAPDVVCVPDMLVAPGEPLDGRFQCRGGLTSSVATTRRHPGHRLLGRAAAGRGRVVRRSRRDHALGVLRHHGAALSESARACAARAGGDGRRAAAHHGGRRHVVARPRAVSHRAACGRRSGHAGGAHQSHRLARRRPAAVRAPRTFAPDRRCGHRALPGMDRRALRRPRDPWRR